MRDLVTRRDIKNIRTRAGMGQGTIEIADALDINPTRVETFMPKEPEVEKAEHEAKIAQVKRNKADNPDNFKLNAGKKRRLRAQIAEEDAAEAAADDEGNEDAGE